MVSYGIIFAFILPLLFAKWFLTKLPACPDRRFQPLLSPRTGRIVFVLLDPITSFRQIGFNQKYLCVFTVLFVDGKLVVSRPSCLPSACLG